MISLINMERRILKTSKPYLLVYDGEIKHVGLECVFVQICIYSKNSFRMQYSDGSENQKLVMSEY